MCVCVCVCVCVCMCVCITYDICIRTIANENKFLSFRFVENKMSISFVIIPL